MSTELSGAQLLALSKAVNSNKAKEASSNLSVGEHSVDFTVRVQGTLTRGKDYEQQIVAKADPWTLLAAALSHLNGVTVNSLVKESLTADPALVKSVKESANDALGAIKAPTKTPCNGKVTGGVLVDLI